MTNMFPLLGIPSPGYTLQETLTLSVNASRGGLQTPDYKEAIIYSSFYDLTPILYFPLRDGARSSQTVVTTALSGKFGLRLFDFTEEPLSIFIELNITGGQELILDLAGGGSGGILDFPSLVGKGKLSGYFQLDSLPEGVTYSDITIRAFYIDYKGGKFNGLQAAQVKCQSTGLWLIEGISEHHRYNVVISIPGYNDIIYGNKATSDHVPRIEPEVPVEPEEPEEPVDPVDPEPEEPIEPEPDIEYLVFEVMASVDENQYTYFSVWPTAGGSGATIDMGDGEVYVYHDMTEFGHTFYSPGTYQIKISGDLNALTFRIPAPTKILSWGKELKGVSAYGSRFELVSNGSNIISVPDHLPPWITTLEYFFEDCVDFNQDISSWDTKNVKYMDGMFYWAENFNQDLSGWCVPLIRSEPYDFARGASSWDLPKPIWGTCPNSEEPEQPENPDGDLVFEVTTEGGGYNMAWFLLWPTEGGAGAFIDISDGRSYSPERMKQVEHVFYSAGTYTITISGDLDAVLFEIPEPTKILSWGKEIKGTRYAGMNFELYPSGTNIVGVPDHLPTWLTSLQGLFSESPDFNQDISSWNTENITNMDKLFYGAENFNQDLSGWCVPHITSEPDDFDTNAWSWELPKPVWGTCPSGEDPEDLVFEVTSEGGGDQESVFTVWPTAGGVGGFINISDGGSYEFHKLDEVNHVFDSPGTYQITISGDLDGVLFYIPAPTKIVSWGKEIKGTRWSGRSFELLPSGTNFISVPDQLPLWMTSLENFFGWSPDFNQDISSWNTENIKYMDMMFYGAESFNQDLSGWCVPHITDKPTMFGEDATAWVLPKPVWGTCPSGVDPVEPEEPELPDGGEFISIIEHADGGVTYVADTAAETRSFYEMDGKWFYVASSGYDLYEKLSLWDDPQYSDDPHTEILVTEGDRSELLTADRIVTSLTNNSNGLVARYMKHFNQYIGSFDTSNWVSFSNSFEGTDQFNQPIGNWNTSKGRQFHTTFSDALKFNQPLPWDVSGCTNRSYMLGMFWGATEFNQDLSGWCVPEILTEPDGFSLDATAWTLPKPVWGTCPSS